MFDTKENVYELLGRCLKTAKREKKTIHLFFNDSTKVIMAEAQIVKQCKHWEVTPTGVHISGNPEAANLSCKVLNATVIDKIALSGTDRYKIVIKY